MIPRNDATQAQVRAADPKASTWLAANAGSGKTRVLTDRVARLLLEGVNPQHILCLTYTKAAASEMQNRLFQRLGEWAMLANDPLKTALSQLGAAQDGSEFDLAHARTLFAQAIETPGGLKIQTIHAFCSSLLRRFPLEANVSPTFVEVEDRAASLLRADILNDFADGPQAGLIEDIARFFTDQNLELLTQDISAKRMSFQSLKSIDDLPDLLDLPARMDENRLLEQVFVGGETDLIHQLTRLLWTGSSNDQKAAAKLTGFTGVSTKGLRLLESVFLYGENAKTPFGAKITTFPTKGLREANGDIIVPLNALMERVQDARETRLALASLQRNKALYRFARAFLPEYAARKQRLGWLDFDDLIQKARGLLNDPSVAQWVLFRLDGGIDHILVDEAQDTSRAQWDVIEKISQEFTSGAGARSDVPRTLFVVGDKKQSIYSFQGADPRAFDRMRDDFQNRLATSGSVLQEMSLDFSFRSAAPILGLVDEVFKGQTAAGFSDTGKHIAFKSELPGRVDVWPFLHAEKQEDDRVWTDPVDRLGVQNHNVQLANRIADWLKDLIDSNATIPVSETERRPIRPGDVMILVRRRSALFSEIIRACKARNLPMAGADRLKVGAELAVRDLASLLRFIETPEDSLSLAEALRSPLFGWSEQDLYDLAHKRTELYLWTALRRRAQDFPATIEVLNDLRAQSDFLRPYDLIERILTRHDGRRNLLARLGPEAEDGINAFLSQALAYERTEIPGLSGFVLWMQTDDLEIKRPVAGDADMIRVMTVHGAKGLEAPLVILPDTAKLQSRDRGMLLDLDGIPLWKSSVADLPAALKDSRADALTREKEEQQRLLYVALTRAEKWLVIAGAGAEDKSGSSWFDQVASAMKTLDAAPLATTDGDGLRLANGAWNDGAEIKAQRAAPDAPLVPPYFSQPVTSPPVAPEILNPSTLPGAKALPGPDGQDEDASLARGTRIHLLLEHLPGTDPSSWSGMSQRLLPDIDVATRLAELAEVERVLTSPDLSFVFAQDALTEVSITAPFGDKRLHGTIDRLIVYSDRVLAIDFKSNVSVPTSPMQCPLGLLRQMGAYAHALTAVYPKHRIETAILWTQNTTLMHLPHDLVIAAGDPTLHLDDDHGASYLRYPTDSQE